MKQRRRSAGVLRRVPQIADQIQGRGQVLEVRVAVIEHPKLQLVRAAGHEREVEALRDSSGSEVLAVKLALRQHGLRDAIVDIERTDRLIVGGAVVDLQAERRAVRTVLELR